MSLLELGNDSVDTALMEGLKKGFEAEIKAVLMEVAEKEVDKVVESMSKRLEVNAASWLSFEERATHIKLKWFLKREA